MAMVQLVSDNFNRANENPLSGSGNWSTIATYGNLQVASNLCEPAAVNTNSNQLWNGGAGADGANWPNDQYSEVTMTTESTLDNNQMGPGVRMGAGTGYVVSVAAGASVTPTLYKLIGGGGYTAVHTYSNIAVSQGDVFRLQVVGTTLTLFHNGVSLGDVTDATYASGKPGLYMYSQSTVTRSQTALWAAGATNIANGGPFLLLNDDDN